MVFVFVFAFLFVFAFSFVFVIAIVMENWLKQEMQREWCTFLSLFL